jgi:chromatin accessibility complex protein 1
MYLSKLAQRNGEDQNSVNYTDLASVVLRKDSMEFLHDIVPKKIKYSEYLRLVEEENDEDDDLF